MPIYDRRQKDTPVGRISMIRSDEDMHVSFRGKRTTGELVIILPGGHQDQLWTGHASKAGDAFRFALRMVDCGAKWEDLIDAFLPADCRGNPNVIGFDD